MPTLKTCSCSFKLFQLIISDNRHAHCVIFCSMQCWIDHDTNLLDIVSTFYNTDLPISIQWSFYSRSNGWDFHFIIPIFGAHLCLSFSSFHFKYFVINWFQYGLKIYRCCISIKFFHVFKTLTKSSPLFFQMEDTDEKILFSFLLSNNILFKTWLLLLAAKTRYRFIYVCVGNVPSKIYCFCFVSI